HCNAFWLRQWQRVPRAGDRYSKFYNARDKLAEELGFVPLGWSWPSAPRPCCQSTDRLHSLGLTDTTELGPFVCQPTPATTPRNCSTTGMTTTCRTDYSDCS